MSNVLAKLKSGSYIRKPYQKYIMISLFSGNFDFSNCGFMRKSGISDEYTDYLIFLKGLANVPNILCPHWGTPLRIPNS